jgi:hypothetical protein
VPKRTPFILAVAFATTGAVRAQEPQPQVPPDEPPPFKLTLGLYHYSPEGRGYDVNLRHTSSLGNVWLGYFRFPAQEVSQWRTGWDRELGEVVRVKPSVQAASGGFVGGSVQAEVGDPWFAALGIGRTNLRPYYNLNFDPNDAYTVQAGYHDKEQGRFVVATMVRDNREHPDQRHFHLTYREGLAGGHRVTLDALYKVGTVEEEGVRIRRWGFTASYDWPRWFVLVAFDPKSNFSSLDLWRLALGTRF